MGMLNELLDIFASDYNKSTKFSVSVNEEQAILKLSEHLAMLLNSSLKKEAPIILCIGTDRSTGDSLGPLTGWRLDPLLRGLNAQLYGTIDDPVHAVNLEEIIEIIKPGTLRRPVIAIDACLGQVSAPGTILVEKGPLRPGIGVRKNLPSVGDISISGIVNVGGFMEYQVLQNTRLSLVLKMAQLIANSVYFAVKKANKQH